MNSFDSTTVIYAFFSSYSNGKKRLKLRKEPAGNMPGAKDFR